MIQNYHSHQWRLETIIQSYHSFPWCWKIIIYIAMVVKIIIHINGAQKFIIFINIFIIQILSTTSMVHRNVSSKFIIHSNGAQTAYQESSLCCQEPWSSSSQEKSPADASSIVMIL